MHGVLALVSYHNFKGALSKEWMIDIVTYMLDMGADTPKCVVMAHDVTDTFKLMEATEEVCRLHADGPTLTMAMGKTALSHASWANTTAAT